jgi:hypothetical protein
MTVHPKSRKNVVRTLFARAESATATTSTLAPERHEADARLGTAPAGASAANIAADEIAADDVAADDGGAAACDVCGHLVDGHDRIALRFCAATLQNALSRGCICPPPDSAHPSARS